MTLAASATRPPMVLAGAFLDQDAAERVGARLGPQDRDVCCPARPTCVPISLLATVFPRADGSRMWTPLPRLPEIRLPDPASPWPLAWPTWLLAESKSTPSPPLSRMKLVAIVFPVPWRHRRSRRRPYSPGSRCGPRGACRRPSCSGSSIRMPTPLASVFCDGIDDGVELCGLNWVTPMKLPQTVSPSAPVMVEERRLQDDRRAAEAGDAQAVDRAVRRLRRPGRSTSGR